MLVLWEGILEETRKAEVDTIVTDIITTSILPDYWAPPSLCLPRCVFTD